MVILKIWAGAFAALILLLCLHVVLQERVEHPVRTQVVRR